MRVATNLFPLQSLAESSEGKLAEISQLTCGGLGLLYRVLSVKGTMGDIIA
jgi:hypothetical protein